MLRNALLRRSLCPGVFCPKDLPLFPARTNAIPSRYKSRLNQLRCPGGDAMASAPRMAGPGPGLNVISGKSVIKHKKGVYPSRGKSLYPAVFPAPKIFSPLSDQDKSGPSWQKSRLSHTKRPGGERNAHGGPWNPLGSVPPLCAINSSGKPLIFLAQSWDPKGPPWPPWAFRSPPG
jgi:hypothetical protein